ncbi:MAG: hypothetical protein AB1765_12185 [Candidatus Hydrogenedentota bacterium]
MGAIVGFKKKLMQIDKPLFLVFANESIKKIIRLTHLENLIQTVDTFDEAVSKILK